MGNRIPRLLSKSVRVRDKNTLQNNTFAGSLSEPPPPLHNRNKPTYRHNPKTPTKKTKKRTHQAEYKTNPLAVKDSPPPPPAIHSPQYIQLAI